MILHTERLTLLSCTPKALETYAASGYSYGPHIESFLEDLAIDPELHGWGVWLVIHTEENRMIGDMGFKDRPNTEKEVEVGYGIFPDYQNRGYATEGLKALIKWAFQIKGVHVIKADCQTDNLPPKRVLAKVGMQLSYQQNRLDYWILKKDSCQ
ncbi:Acetyltransferase [Alkalibacterium sp. AK22]|uniref:GNAT family N-acetyltransferase n=1 Tax=Alkalibacterium sp. AK22 TaxID=1229520 RepID=UPI000447F775|nr:GNAT family N-acetyltransferase [Alkalibacterium sp. AK22]EXJ22533.1 Acetyltransferase [Alkalibacterium sp. AK22]